MNALSNGRSIALGLTIGAAGLGAIIAACSGGGSSGNQNGNGADSGNPGSSSDGGGTTSVSTQPTTCANPQLQVTFSPMYSAYIPNSTAGHTFSLPALSDGTGNITWGASDPTKVSMVPDPTAPGQIMITVQGTGSVDIIATESGGGCGVSTLNITTNTDDDWQTGNARYNDGVSITFGPPGGRGDGGRPEGGFGPPPADAGSRFEEDGGTACTNCHGPTATNGFYKDVAHTPEQTAGFSDQDLISIIVDGVVPDGGYFDPNVIIPDASADPTGNLQARAYRVWQGIHRWSDIQPSQQAGIVAYLRSLTPAPQDGTPGLGSGGRRDGGAGRRDGGGFPSQDSGGGTQDSGGQVQDDSGSAADATSD